METETGIEDSYVYDGEVFSEVNEYSARAVTKGKIDYTYWAIHQGAGFGNILEDDEGKFIYLILPVNFNTATN